jgi:peptide/nickel transport system substrate-binding protein
LSGLAAAIAARASAAGARGRTPVGGRLAFAVPWSLATIDPHELADPGAALLAPALFDTLVVPDEKLGFRPALAEALPAHEQGVTVVRLRSGLRTASGKALDGRDVVASLKRARGLGAGALLYPLGEPAVLPKEPLAVQLQANVAAVTRALSSPLAAIVPRSFDPRRPDGTGSFAATRTGAEIVLARNANAAMGGAFLDEVRVKEAADLQESLRDFEAGRHDLGWLGLGLFGSRAEAVRFDVGAPAVVVLAASRDMPSIGAAGALQRLVDLLPRSRLGHLGLGTLPPGSDAVAWEEAPIDLHVDSGSPQLGEIAKAVADILSRPGHEVRVRRAPGAEVLARRRRGESILSCHVVRPALPGAAGLAIALATFDDPSRAREIAGKPPRGTSGREIGRELRVAFLGEVRVSGGIVPDVALGRSPLGGWDLGATFKKRRG